MAPPASAPCPSPGNLELLPRTSCASERHMSVPRLPACRPALECPPLQRPSPSCAPWRSPGVWPVWVAPIPRPVRFFQEATGCGHTKPLSSSSFPPLPDRCARLGHTGATAWDPIRNPQCTACCGGLRLGPLHWRAGQGCSAESALCMALRTGAPLPLLGPASKPRSISD